MALIEKKEEVFSFLKSLGFPALRVHYPVNHFDFTKNGRNILVIGPMGAGKTEFAAKIYRDSQIALKKSEKIKELTTDGKADRRIVYFIRSRMEERRFPEAPKNAIVYRGGYKEIENITSINSSFELEKVIDKHPEVGTWIIDEAGFYDERLAYVVENYRKKHNVNFVFPMLILNFRKDIFNRTSRLIVQNATDVFPLTAYCEHPDCIRDAYYTYRYYLVDGVECPALYFDPLIIVGGNGISTDPKLPNYSTRCDKHHYLPGKEYTFLILKPLGELAYAGNINPLIKELLKIKNDIHKSELYNHFIEKYVKADKPNPIMMNSLRVSCIAEKALIYLFAEENIISNGQLKWIAREISGNMDYINERLVENKKNYFNNQQED